LGRSPVFERSDKYIMGSSFFITRNGGSVLIQFDVKDGNDNLVGSVMAHVGQSNYSMPINNLRPSSFSTEKRQE